MMTKKIEESFPKDLSTESSTESSTDSSTVSLAVFEQVKWERDVALKQLEELGYGFGEKIRTDEDCIRREDALMALTGEWTEPTDELIYRFIKRIKNLPPVKPKFTDEEIQTMQDLEQAQIQKAYEIGKTEDVEIKDCISRHKAVYIAKHECNNLKIAIMLEELPPVNPKSGKWKKTTDGYDSVEQ